MSGYVLTTPVSVEPVSLAEMKDFLRVSDDDQDAMIAGVISTARELVEFVTGRALAPQTWTLSLDQWCTSIDLEKTPVTEVSTVSYVDEDGDSVELVAGDDYRVSLGRSPARVVLIADRPALLQQADALQVVFVAGYATPADCLPTLKHSVKIVGRYLFEQEDPSQPIAASRLPTNINSLLTLNRVGGNFA